MVIGISLFILCIVFILKTFSRKSENQLNETYRFFKGNPSEGNWNPDGKIYTEGLILIENRRRKEIRFLKQSELCDISIL